jgi:hypothetical protein
MRLPYEGEDRARQGGRLRAIGFDRSQPLSAVVTLCHITERRVGR